MISVISKIKNSIYSLIKKNVFIRILAKKIRYVIKRNEYCNISRKNNIDNKTILFESFMGRSYSDSPKAIYIEMLKDDFFKDFKFVWAFKDVENYGFLKNDRTTLVKSETKDYYKFIASSKYWITNSRLAEYIKKKKNQIYIQCWHGTPLKKLGYDILLEEGNALNTIKEIREKYESDAKRYDYMISPSAFCTEKFISAFNLKKLKKEDIIIEMGYPRNDFLYKINSKEIIVLKNKFKIPLNKKIILYAPTWRDNQHEVGIGYTYDLKIDFDVLQKKLQDKYVIIFRTHYFVSNSFDFKKYKGFIYDMSNYDDINELYAISDMIITDYSSVFFDYANLKRPIIFYMYDLEEYQEKLRDFYFSLDELPGPIVKTQKELELAILNIDKYNKKYEKKYNYFNNKFNYLDNKDCSRRVIEKIFK